MSSKSEADTPFAELLTSVRECRICEDFLPLGPRPVVQLDPQARIVDDVLQVVQRAAREVVVDDDLGHVLRDEPIDGVRADQPGTADDGELLASDVQDLVQSPLDLSPPLPDGTGRDAGNRGASRHVLDHNCAEADAGIVADADLIPDHGSRRDLHAVADHRAAA